MSVEYHYMAGTPVEYAPCSAPCYHAVPTSGSPFIPEFVDGLRVTSRINNPTTFARALSIPLTDLGVSAVAASRVNPTCAPEISGEGNGAPPPFTRFRAAIEHEMNDPNLGNSLCHPFEFWSSGGDFGGNWKNLVSFNTGTFSPYNSQGNDITMQLLTDFDYRHGPLTITNTNGLSNYQHCCITETLQPCFDPDPFGCADMRGSQQSTGNPVHQDIGNWLFWLWGGRLSLTSIYPIETNTRYPSNAANQGGTIGTLQERPGDWAELYNGNFGQNVQEAVYDSSTQFGVMTPPGLPVDQGGLNWGTVLTRTIYLWGEPEDIVASGSMSSTQKFDQWTEELPCDPPSPGCTQIEEHDAWMDVNLIGTYPNYELQGVQGNDQVRVRFTRAMPFLFFANLQGNHGARSVDPSNNDCDLPNPGSSAWGILPSMVVPPPPGGGGECGGWSPGGGVYKSQVPPEGP
jgi:hypothetical protein